MDVGYDGEGESLGQQTVIVVQAEVEASNRQESSKHLHGKKECGQL